MRMNVNEAVEVVNVTVSETSPVSFAIGTEIRTGGAVDSVNGQIGDVILSAADVGALPDSTAIPTKTSDLTNDSGYISSIPAEYVTDTELQNAISGKANTADLANVATTGDYDDLIDKPSIPTKTSDLTNDSGFINSIPSEYVTDTELQSAISGKADSSSLATVATSGDYDDLIDKPTIPSKTSDLTNDSGFITGMTILSYGSSTWQDFLDAYHANKVVYCRASANANPASGAQNRLAFLAYVEGADNPSKVEFQYYRSVSSHTVNQQGDQVYVYTLNSSGWSVTVREAYSAVQAGTGLSRSYASGTVTLGLASTIVTSVNEQTGAVSLSIPSSVSDLNDASDYQKVITVENKTSSDTSVTLTADKFYVFPTMATLAVTVSATGLYMFRFQSGSTATSLTVTGATMPDSFTVEANKIYEVNIYNGYGVVSSWMAS